MGSHRGPGRSRQEEGGEDEVGRLEAEPGDQEKVGGQGPGDRPAGVPGVEPARGLLGGAPPGIHEVHEEREGHPEGQRRPRGQPCRPLVGGVQQFAVVDLTGRFSVLMAAALADNPDLVERFAKGWELAPMADMKYWYSGDQAEKGYTDFPDYQKALV